MLEHMVYCKFGFLFDKKYICFFGIGDFENNEFAFIDASQKPQCHFAFCFPPNENLSLGLDLLRGTHVTLDSRSEAGSM